MPPLVRFMLRHAAVGFALGLMVAAIIVATDALHLRSLAMATQMGWLGLGVFCFLTGLTIGSLQIGFAVMLQGTDGEDQDGRGGGHGARLVPIPVRVHRRR
jgi:hypothetical protein